MPLLISTGFGLLVREFHKRIKPNNRAVPALTRGLYTTPKRDVIRRKRTYQNDPFSIDECKQRLGGNCVRRYYSTTTKYNDVNWTPVYRFGGIRIYSLVSRAKFIQTAISLFLVPYQSYLYFTNGISTTSFVLSLLFASVAPIILIGFTRYFNKMIGVISYDGDRELLRFGYLGFWGGRKNLIVPLGDVLPLTNNYDVNTAPQIVTLELGKKRFLLLNLRNCEIVDEEIAKEIFGNLKYFEKFN